MRRERIVAGRGVMIREKARFSSKRIEICGIIASGKTTLAQTLVKERSDLRPIYEDFSANPFYEDFYRDPSAFAFETELTFFLQHYHQVKVCSNSAGITVCDFSLLLDIAYSNVTLPEREQLVFRKVVEEAESHIVYPDVVIYIECAPKTALRRIKERKRREERSIQLEYIVSLHDALREEIEKARGTIHILSIDADREDFRATLRDTDTKRTLLSELESIYT